MNQTKKWSRCYKHNFKQSVNSFRCLSMHFRKMAKQWYD